MYRNYLNLKETPFAEEVNPDIFFPEANRTKILRAVYADLQQDTSIVRVTGTDGTGKTMLCRLLAQLIPDTFKVIYLDTPTGSFDALLHAVCLELGMRTVHAQDMLSELYTLLEQYKKQKKKVVLIIDESERMFPAALERLIRTVSITEDTLNLQVVLAGRPELNDHVEQLHAYCADVEVQSSHLLEPLTEEEIGAYLNFRLKAAGLSAPTSSEPVFSDGAVRKIAEYAHGNLRHINILATEALRQVTSAESSFPVLPVHVTKLHNTSDQEQGKQARAAESDRLRSLFALAAILLLLLVLLVQYNATFRSRWRESENFFWQTEKPLQAESDLPKSNTLKHNELPPVTAAEALATNVEEGMENGEQSSPDLSYYSLSENAATDIEPIELEYDGHTILIEDEIIITEEHVADNAIEPQVFEKNEENTELPSEQEPSAEELDIQLDQSAISIAEAEPDIPNKEEEVEEILEITTISLQAAPVEPEKLLLEEEVPEVKQEKIVHLVPGMRKTKQKAKPEHTDEESTIKNRLKAEQERVLLSQTAISAAAISLPKNKAPLEMREAYITEPKIQPLTVPRPDMANADQLYQELLTAGARLRSNFYADKYTIHLLMLSSENAVSKVKTMIVRDEYLEYKGRLHILHRQTRPASVLVFYGVYNSMDEAQAARNKMPLFLRKHHPYALPVASALNKAAD